MKRILIFSDSRWRDSFGDALLAWKLSKLGMWPIVVSYDLWDVAVKTFKPHLVLMNHLHGTRNNTIANIVKRNGGIVATLPTEGRPNTPDIAEWFFSQLNSELLDVLFAWNELDEPHEKVAITGHPRFEIYNYYRDLIEPRESFRERYNLDPNKRVIGITTSFPQAKFATYGQAMNENDWKDLGMVSVPGRESPTEFAKKERAAMIKFQTRILIKKYREDLEAQYILKPHPMSDVQMWAEFCHKNDIRLCSQEYIFNFLNGIDVLFARENCMTIIEGFLSEVEVQVAPDDDVTRAVSWSASDIEYYLGTSNYLSDNVPSDIISQLIQQYVTDLEVYENPAPHDITNLENSIRRYNLDKLYPNAFEPHLGKPVIHTAIQEWLRALENRI